MIEKYFKTLQYNIIEMFRFNTCTCSGELFVKRYFFRGLLDIATRKIRVGGCLHVRKYKAGSFERN